MPPTIQRVLFAIGVMAFLSSPCAAQFAVSQNPIPPAALHLTYKTTSNMWEFVDSFAMPYDDMHVLLCVAQEALACDLAGVSFSGTCADLASHPVISSGAWRSIDDTPDACLQRPIVQAAMHSESPNKLFVNNSFTSLQRFHTGASTVDNSTIVLRVQFVYLKRIGEGAVHVLSNGYQLVFEPLSDTTRPVLVRSECSARGFSAPGMQLPPSLGGAVMVVEVNEISGERMCTWQCQLPYVKMPWNAAAFTATSSTAASCVATPESFAAVALSFVIQYPSTLQMQFNSKQMLLGLDDLAVKMADAMRARFGLVRVLLSSRGSTVNRRQVGEILTWVRNTNTLDGVSSVITNNPLFSLRPLSRPLRRLLAENENVTDTESLDDFVVDVVIVAEQSEEANCCLVEGSVAAQQELNASEFDFGMLVTSFDPPEVETSAIVTFRKNNTLPHAETLQSPPIPTQHNEFPWWFWPLILVCFLMFICICLFQPDGLYNPNTDKTQQFDENEEEEQEEEL